MKYILIILLSIFVTACSDSLDESNGTVLPEPSPDSGIDNEIENPMTLPIEVIGDGGTIIVQNIEFTQSQIENATFLFLYANNLSYENKGSVSINDGPWISLNHVNEDIHVYNKETVYGGMQHGSMSSIRLYVSLEDVVVPSDDPEDNSKTPLVEGVNKFAFRFNFSDGISSGFRIFQLNLMDKKFNNLLNTNAIPMTNPTQWEAPEGYSDNASITAGRELWYNAQIWNHNLTKENLDCLSQQEINSLSEEDLNDITRALFPDLTDIEFDALSPFDKAVPILRCESIDVRSGIQATWYGNPVLASHRIKAKCTDCHTQDGRDLAYFSYSNKVIIEKAKFHNLTEEQGNQIAAYIRSLDVPSYGRPWNPPYQPGASIAFQPVDQWAAGAGIDDVLADDDEMRPYLFPNGTGQINVNAFFDATKMHDTTSVPISLQLPDWARWLPLIHPKDAYGEFWETHTQDWLNPESKYQELRAFLANNSREELITKKAELFSQLNEFWRSFHFFFTTSASDTPSDYKDNLEFTGNWRNMDALADQYLASSNLGYSQMARTSLARLLAVKNFEIHQEFQLEDLALSLTIDPTKQTPRQWLTGINGAGYNVLQASPHFTSCHVAESHECRNFESQSKASGFYESNAWFELQLVLNPGNGWPNLNGPVNYGEHLQLLLDSTNNQDPDITGHYNQIRSDRELKSSQLPIRHETLRYYRALNTMYQTKSWEHGQDSAEKKDGFLLNQQGPWSFFGVTESWNLSAHGLKDWSARLNDIDDGLEVKVVNAMLTQLANQLSRPVNAPSTYYRATGIDMRFALDPKEKSEYVAPIENEYRWADRFWLLAEEWAQMGADPSRINAVIDWCEDAWPNMNWELRRPEAILAP